MLISDVRNYCRNKAHNRGYLSVFFNRIPLYFSAIFCSDIPLGLEFGRLSSLRMLLAFQFVNNISSDLLCDFLAVKYRRPAFYLYFLSIHNLNVMYHVLGEIIRLEFLEQTDRLYVIDSRHRRLVYLNGEYARVATADRLRDFVPGDGNYRAEASTENTITLNVSI